MKKYLVDIEFRYMDAPRYEHDSGDNSKTLVVGIYDTFKEACENGNKLLEKLESIFPIHTYPDGRQAKKDRFSLNGGSFGSKKTLVTNRAYLKTPFEFYAHIKTLSFDDLDIVINNICDARIRFNNLEQ